MALSCCASLHQKKNSQILLLLSLSSAALTLASFYSSANPFRRSPYVNDSVYLSTLWGLSKNYSSLMSLGIFGGSSGKDHIYTPAFALPPRLPRQSDESYLGGLGPSLNLNAALFCCSSSPLPQILSTKKKDFHLWGIYTPRRRRWGDFAQCGCPLPWLIRRREIVCHI